MGQGPREVAAGAEPMRPADDFYRVDGILLSLLPQQSPIHVIAPDPGCVRPGRIRRCGPPGRAAPGLAGTAGLEPDVLDVLLARGLSAGPGK